MKKNLFLLAAAFCFVSPLFAQSPNIQWQSVIGGSNDERFTNLQQTADGGYILAGQSISNISGNKIENCLGSYDYWVLKLDEIGNIIWQNTIGGEGSDYLWSIDQTSDGGYIIGGNSDSKISGDKTENSGDDFDYWVLKLDGVGNIQWQNTIGGAGLDNLLNVQQTADGGYILGGYSDSNISGDKTEDNMGGYDYWIVKLDSAGNIQWQNTIGGNDADNLYNLAMTTDGGYLLAGKSSSSISGDKNENNLGDFDYWVVKLDAGGNIQWQNTIGGNALDTPYSLQQTSDGGCIIGGYSRSGISGNKTEDALGNYDYWVVKLDATGAIQWQNTIGGNSGEGIQSLQQTTDGGYILGGSSESDISLDKTENNLGVYDYWVIKLYADGNIQWQKTVGGDQADGLQAIQQTTDGGYILGGYSDSNISGNKTKSSLGGRDFWVVKLAPDLVPIAGPSVAQKGLTIHPNPTANAIFVRTDMQRHVRLCNALGQTLAARTVQNSSEIDLSNHPDGFYFLIETATGQAHKILKTK